MKVLTVGKLYIGISWAKSLCWNDTTSSQRKITNVFSVCIVEIWPDKILRIIVGPVSISAGIVS